jgi:hypothetical protein
VHGWGPTTYGDPCRECGYGWSIPVADAVALVAATPDRYAELLRGHDGSEHAAGIEWSAGAYVCHVTDNLRIWAERLAGAALGPARTITPYDTDLLARARRYDAVPLDGALWSLRQAARAWADAVELAGAHGVVLVHPDRGEITAADVARANAHDAHHHAWDLARIIEERRSPRV